MIELHKTDPFPKTLYQKTPLFDKLALLSVLFQCVE